MKRLMYWNVRDFGINKIAEPSRKRTRGSSITKSQASQDRYGLMRTFFDEVDPDIFVLVETEAPALTARGQLVQNLGSLTLLEYLQNGHDDSWRLVPPLKTGPKECVSIFYKLDNLIFTGPFVWPGGGGGTAQPNGITGDYPNDYRDGLGNRTIPVGAPNAGTSERRVAARVEFTFHAGHATHAGNPINFNTQRAPYLATFAEVDNNNPPGLLRNLSIFAIHAPASNAARAYLRDLDLIAQIRDNLGNNEVRVIAGDFNWNLLDNNLDMRTSYDELVNNAGYTLALTPLGNAPDPAEGYASYYATHLTSTGSAQWWSTQDEDVYFPGYAYTSETDFAIDNIYTRYGQNVAAPNPNNFTIINPVVGSEYIRANRPNPPDPNITGGTIQTPSRLDTAYYRNNINNPSNQYLNGMAKNFRGWDNYGYIYSTSDHLPLVIDI